MVGLQECQSHGVRTRRITADYTTVLPQAVILLAASGAAGSPIRGTDYER